MSFPLSPNHGSYRDAIDGQDDPGFLFDPVVILTIVAGIVIGALMITAF